VLRELGRQPFAPYMLLTRVTQCDVKLTAAARRSKQTKQYSVETARLQARFIILRLVSLALIFSRDLSTIHPDTLSCPRFTSDHHKNTFKFSKCFSNSCSSNGALFDGVFFVLARGSSPQSGESHCAQAKQYVNIRNIQLNAMRPRYPATCHTHTHTEVACQAVLTCGSLVGRNVM
jgi:hypothetical protein